MKRIFSLSLIGCGMVSLVVAESLAFGKSVNKSTPSQPRVVVMERAMSADDRSLLEELHGIFGSLRDRVAHVAELDLPARQQLTNNVYNFRRDLVSHQGRVDIGTEVLQMIRRVDGFSARIARSTTEHSSRVRRQLFGQE